VRGGEKETERKEKKEREREIQDVKKSFKRKKLPKM
jgi:hypothetical protein